MYLTTDLSLPVSAALPRLILSRDAAHIDERIAVLIRRSQHRECTGVPGRAVALVLGEPVARYPGFHLDHEPVPTDLCQHAGRSDTRGRGIATLLLTHILAEARQGGYDRLYLETGSQDFFAPARRLYQRHGFDFCPPFAGYGDDPNSSFMTLALDPIRP